MTEGAKPQNSGQSPAQTGGVQAAQSATNAPMPEFADSASDIEARIPNFPPLKNTAENVEATTINRFRDMNVTVSAELGRIELTVGELMKLRVGSVLELSRPLSEPVDLVSQAVRLARGEVVVIDDCFAIRIKQIETPRQESKQ